MKCPSCKYPLIVLEIEEIEIDHCLACGGVWLDEGELDLLLNSARNGDKLMATLDAEVEGHERHVRCPICRDHLEKVLYGVDDRVRLDKCPRDHGLWFDQGELLAVIKMGEFPPDNRIYQLLHEIFGNTHVEG